ncbi:LirA/MavJ family T4SS effector [Burkholderia guangdongensis]|uniref:LirA/MavJ family T4SS effector n=1 Tax=Burkholderia guangdongensis TaxID=1792500 RepID=UPI0015CBEC7B|nr:LirA/MavJ family T4SS effector [Burkholderia guangdongensis]
MASTVFTDAAQARTSLDSSMFVHAEFDTVEKKFKRDGDDLRKKGYIDGFAAIAHFLCDRQRFLASLERVSKRMWIQYRYCDRNEQNKFTKAMGVVARRYGFAFQNQMQINTNGARDRARGNAPIGIVLVAGDPLLGTHVRKKLFWKDSMDSRHGEHSHSLQWLAIAESGVVGNQTADYYAQTVDFRCSNVGLSVSLWQWLVDCFPSDMKKFATEKLNKSGETLESDSFRSPQCLMDYLLMGDRRQLADHFISTYLYWRYRNRNWLAEQTRYSDEGDTYTVVDDIQTRAIATHRLDRRSDEQQWMAGKVGGNVVRYRRNPGSGPSPGGNGKTRKEGHEVRFHNIPGHLYDSYAR